jgi:hypothetical protein
VAKKFPHTLKHSRTRSAVRAEYFGQTTLQGGEDESVAKGNPAPCSIITTNGARQESGFF